MKKHIVECPDTGEDRDECPCEKCAEHRQTWEEFLREEAQKDWDRRRQSRAIDAEYVNRRMPGGYDL